MMQPTIHWLPLNNFNFTCKEVIWDTLFVNLYNLILYSSFENCGFSFRKCPASRRRCTFVAVFFVFLFVCLFVCFVFNCSSLISSSLYDKPHLNKKEEKVGEGGYIMIKMIKT